MVEADLGNTKVAVVDCPGFNDTYRSPIEILEEISRILCTQSALGKTLKLKGIIYLHSLEKEKAEGSDVDAFRTLRELVGDSVLPHVCLVTTKWGKFRAHNRSIALKREAQLREIFWAEMIEKGAQMGRFEGGDTASAQGIVAQLIKMEEVTLAIQHELVTQGKRLHQTSAGAFLGPFLDREEAEIKRQLSELAAQIQAEKNKTKRVITMAKQQAAETHQARVVADRVHLDSQVGRQAFAAVTEQKKQLKKYKWRNDLQLFCNVLGVGMAVVSVAACSVM